MTRSEKTTRRGFTLIEMLVVVSIMAIVLALSFPMIASMKRESSASAGVNTITVAIPSARRYATSGITFPNDLDNVTPGDQAGMYSGAAAIFTPSGEIRLVSQKNSAGASSTDFISGSRFLERHGPSWLKDQSGAGLPQRELNGFTDLAIDYVLLPSDTGVAGINRVAGGPLTTASSTGPPLLLPPPFAVWFNQNGYLVATGWDPTTTPPRANDYQFVYYDGNQDGDIRLVGRGSTRGSIGSYNPDTYNPDSGDFDPNNWLAVAEKYRLPFEKIEAVVGVYVYSRQAFQSANDAWAEGVTDTARAAPPWTDMTATDNDARWEWMRANGQVIMFSRQTGAMMRNRDE